MRHILILVGLSLVLAFPVAGGGELEKKTRPANAETYSDQLDVAVGSIVQGLESRTEAVTDASGRTFERRYTVAVPVRLPERKWLIGANGWFDSDGCNIERVADVNRADGKSVASPLKSIITMVNGREQKIALEAGDAIVSIEGKPVKAMHTFYVALQTAVDPTKVRIEFRKQGDEAPRDGFIRLVAVEK
jgi:hypothetical protein